MMGTVSAAALAKHGAKAPNTSAKVLRSIPQYEQISVYDRGDTWSDEIMLRSDGVSTDLGYPASVECRDGSVITVYYQALPGDRKCSVLYTKWRLPER